MKKKQYLFPKVSLMSCLLLTAMPLQNVLADVPNVQETLLIEGNEELIDALQNNAYVKLMNGYKEEKLRLIDKRVRPFLRKVYEGNLSEVNAEVDAFVKDIKDNETDVLGIQQSFKSLISTLSPKIGYFTFMQDAKYLEDLGTLTASELDESYLDLLENHVGKHRILVKYENLQEGRIPLEGITVPLKNRIQALNNIQQEIEHLPEVHDSFLYLDKSDYEKKLENLLFLIDLRLSSFVDYDRLAVIMDQEIKPLYTELHAIEKNRQIQMFRDVFPNIEKAESIIKTLDDVTDPKVKYKKLHEILEAYIEKCGDIRKKNILSSILSRYEYLVDSMKEELRNYLETDVFKSSTNSGDKHHNETIKLVNSEEFYNRIYYANSIAELKMIKSDLDLITTFESKKENNSDTDTETTPIKIEKPIESVQPDKEIEKEVSKEGWIKKSNLWYYKEKSGKLATGWKKVSGKWYYLEQSGAMATG
ncbi:N-acetylmuramoyl-L-alanine amidase family protein, partial [Erysipelothrix tonsillarum]|uniref:N-acetylmuramoyl-L-alanine amidase family protein n=1 Tax=Erysipelothrix tonsillarum TaxID=38402 RepID=UPI00037BADC7